MHHNGDGRLCRDTVLGEMGKRKPNQALWVPWADPGAGICTSAAEGWEMSN